MLDGGEGANDALVVGDFGIGVEGDVEVDLFGMLEIESSGAGSGLTRTSTRLPFRSTSEMESLLERDMVGGDVSVLCGVTLCLSQLT